MDWLEAMHARHPHRKPHIWIFCNTGSGADQRVFRYHIRSHTLMHVARRPPFARAQPSIISSHSPVHPLPSPPPSPSPPLLLRSGEKVLFFFFSLPSSLYSFLLPPFLLSTYSLTPTTLTPLLLGLFLAKQISHLNPSA